MQPGDRTSTIFSVVGAKDGVGVSTFALNSAFLLAKQGRQKVLLVDFDFNCQGDLASMIDVEWKSAVHVLGMMDRGVPAALVDGYLSRHDAGVSYLCAFEHGGEIDARLFSPESVAHLFQYLSQAFDVIVVDCGSVLSAVHAPVIAGSNRIMIVTLGLVNCIAHARRRYELLEQAYIPVEKVEYVVNRWSDDGKVPRRLVADKLARPVEHFLPLDAAGMEKAFEKAAPIIMAANKSPYVKSMEACIAGGLFRTGGCAYSAQEALKIDGGIMSERWLRPFCTAAPKSQAPQGPAKIASDEHAAREVCAEDEEWIALKQRILTDLFKVVDLKKMGVGGSDEDRTKLTRSTTDSIMHIINDIGEDLVPQGKRKQLVEEVLHEALGLGPLERLLSDESVSEVMINGKDQIYIERKGRLSLTKYRFTSEKQLQRIIERIVSPIGRRVDESTPLVDARLADGSRVNVIIPPLAIKGPTVTIRRFSRTPLAVDDLIDYGTLDRRMADFIKACIEAKLNIVISGGTGSGKTTLLNVMTSFIPEGDRIITIEDAAELRLNQPHTITLESRPANLEGKGAITIRDLVRNALRMRPDRIVVGECRGGEALDMLQAMNTGHDGSMTTVHANSAKDAISRLETLVLYSGIDLPSRAIREQIACGIHLIVQLSRFSDGSRKVADISEITGMEGNVVTQQSIFRYQQTGIDEDRSVVGAFAPTGVVPKFFDELKQKGMNLSRDMFIQS
jgi:septum site-determining protein MinD